MDFGTVITAGLFFLQAKERHADKAKVRDRIRFLRLLKSGECESQRLLHSYRQQGYAGLTSPV
ncbi:MAG: hypothetical protein JWQ14_3185 [Adhaeribacter sp.]|jgi:hypothetical protein|nr:hypothetical protein [Adhaeribacter sp.]